MSAARMMRTANLICTIPILFPCSKLLVLWLPNVLNQVLDLSSNSLVTIEGLKDINLLTWLNLANNNIKAMENLNQVGGAQRLKLDPEKSLQNVHLEHIDLSGNAITVTTDLSALKNLNTLMLHSNKITSLRQVFSSLSMSC